MTEMEMLILVCTALISFIIYLSTHKILTEMANLTERVQALTTKVAETQETVNGLVESIENIDLDVTELQEAIAELRRIVDGLPSIDPELDAAFSALEAKFEELVEDTNTAAALAEAVDARTPNKEEEEPGEDEPIDEVPGEGDEEEPGEDEEDDDEDEEEGDPVE